MYREFHIFIKNLETFRPRTLPGNDTELINRPFSHLILFNSIEAFLLFFCNSFFLVNALLIPVQGKLLDNRQIDVKTIFHGAQSQKTKSEVFLHDFSIFVITFSREKTFFSKVPKKDVFISSLATSNETLQKLKSIIT